MLPVDLISVVVTTYNRSEALKPVLSALSQQDDKGFEIISPKDTKVHFAGNPSGYFWFSYDAHASADALTAGAAESAARAAAVARLAEAAASLK